MEWLALKQWSPYVVGTGIGLLTGLTFLLSNKALACSTTFARTAGMIEKAFRGDKVHDREYFKKIKPEIDWQCMLVGGIFIGGFISSMLSGSFQWRFVYDWWGAVVSTNPMSRLLGGFAGGVILGFAARWTGGCTSGHGISGMIQLALSSIVAVMVFFSGGIAVAFWMLAIFS